MTSSAITAQEGEGHAFKAALMSSPGQQVAASEGSFSGDPTPSGAELAPASGAPIPS